MCKSLFVCLFVFLEDKCGLIFPILALPMWVQHGTVLQIPHESIMGCPYNGTHINNNNHLGPVWVIYVLLAV